MENPLTIGVVVCTLVLFASAAWFFWPRRKPAEPTVTIWDMDSYKFPEQDPNTEVVPFSQYVGPRGDLRTVRDGYWAKPAPRLGILHQRWVTPEEAASTYT